MDTVVEFDLDGDFTHMTPQPEDSRHPLPPHHRLTRSATSPPAFHPFRLKEPAVVQSRVHDSILRGFTSTSDVLTQGTPIRGREDGMGRSLDGQSASAVETGAVGVREMPGEFKEDFPSQGQETREAEGETLEEPGQMAASESRTSCAPASASGSTETAMLSEKQLGKLPALESQQRALEAGSGSAVDQTHKTDDDELTGNQLHIFQPRPRRVRIRPKKALQNWEVISAVVGSLPPLAFAACRTISQYGLGLANTRQLDTHDDTVSGAGEQEKVERRVLRPVPVIEQGISFPRLYDPADMCTLLFSTRGYEESNMLASHIRLCGLQARPEKWTLLSMADRHSSHQGGQTDDKNDFSLVTLAPLKTATKLITLAHGMPWTSCGMGIKRQICVMLVEPRRGGEVLIEGLTMPDDGAGPLMRKLTLFFLNYNL